MSGDNHSNDLRKLHITIIALVIVLLIAGIFTIVIVNREDEKKPDIEKGKKIFEEKFPDTNATDKGIMIIGEGTPAFKQVQKNCLNFREGTYYIIEGLQDDKKIISYIDAETKEIVCVVETDPSDMSNPLPKPKIEKNVEGKTLIEADPSKDIVGKENVQYIFSLTEEEAYEVLIEERKLEINFFPENVKGTFYFNALPNNLQNFDISHVVYDGDNFLELKKDIAEKITNLKVILK